MPDGVLISPGGSPGQVFFSPDSHGNSLPFKLCNYNSTGVGGA